MNEFFSKIEELIRTRQISKEEAAALLLYLKTFPNSRPVEGGRPYDIGNIPIRRLFSMLSREFDFDFQYVAPYELYDFFVGQGVLNQSIASKGIRRVISAVDFNNTVDFNIRVITPEEVEADFKKAGQQGDMFPKYEDDAVLPAFTNDGRYVYITPFQMRVAYVNGIKMRYLVGGDYVEPHNLKKTVDELSQLSKWTTSAGDEVYFDGDADIKDDTGKVITPNDLQYDIEYVSTWGIVSASHVNEFAEYILNIPAYDDDIDKKIGWPSWVKDALKKVKSSPVKYTIYATGVILAIRNGLKWRSAGLQKEVSAAIADARGIAAAEMAQKHIHHFDHTLHTVLDGYKILKGGSYVAFGEIVKGLGGVGITLAFMWLANSARFTALIGEYTSASNPFVGLAIIALSIGFGMVFDAIVDAYTESEFLKRIQEANKLGFAPGAYATHGLQIPMNQFGHILEVALHREFLRRQEIYDENGNPATLDVILYDWNQYSNTNPQLRDGYDWREDNILPKDNPTYGWNLPPGLYPIHFGQNAEEAKERLKEAVKDDLNEKNKNRRTDPNLEIIPPPIIDVDDLDFFVPNYPWGEPWPDWVPSFEDLAEEAIKNGHGNKDDLNTVRSYNNFMNGVAVDVEMPDGTIVPNISNNDKKDYKNDYVDNITEKLGDKIATDAAESTKDPQTPSVIENKEDGSRIIKPGRKKENIPSKPSKTTGVVTPKKQGEQNRPNGTQSPKIIPPKKSQENNTPNKKGVVIAPIPKPTTPANKKTGGRQLSSEERFRKRMGSLGILKDDPNKDSKINESLNRIKRSGKPPAEGGLPWYILKNDGSVELPYVPSDGGSRNNAGSKIPKERKKTGPTGGATSGGGSRGGSGGVPPTGGGSGPAKTCFPHYTLVSTPNGKIQISQLTVGDVVYSYDESGKISESKITHKFVHDNEEKSDVYEYIFSDGKKVHITLNHPVLLSSGKYEQIGNVTENDLLVDEYGNYLSIISQKFIDNMVVYNLEVEENHTYIAEGIRVHNAILKDERVNRNMPGTGPYSPWDGFRGPYVEGSTGGGGRENGTGGGGRETGTGGGGTGTGGGTTEKEEITCFPSWTKISTPNGFIEIKDIKINDIILCYDIDGNIVTSKVSHYINHGELEKTEVFRYTLSENETLYITDNHAVLNIENKFVQISTMEIGEYLIKENGQLSKIVSKESLGNHIVYNISTENYGTYIADGIRVYGRDWYKTRY